jgi:hypothetical protein
VRLLEELGSSGGNRNERTVPRLTAAFDEASVIGLFPYGEARTRRSPGLEHLGIGSLAETQPLKQIENEVIEVVGHGAPS